MSLMDYVVDEFEREDLQSSHKGHTVLLCLIITGPLPQAST